MWSLISGHLLPLLIESASAIPHFLSVPKRAEEAMEETLEYSFRALTAILYGYESEIVKQNGTMQAIITKIFKVLDLNVHKCEDLSMENAAECL